MDGTTAMKKLKNYEETRDIPVIAVSANAMESDIEKALAAGFTAYITKPFDIPRFLVEVDRFLKPENQPMIDSTR
jgi:CheY-like chemotaxis protein